MAGGDILRRTLSLGPGMTRGIDTVTRVGQGLASRSGILFTGLAALDMLEKYTDVEDEVAKMGKMEARMIDRLAVAENTLEKARRLPPIANSRSVQQLEATLGQIREYLDYLASCGPLLRGASAGEAISIFGRLGGWLTDKLVAVQVNMMLALTNGTGSGSVTPPQVNAGA